MKKILLALILATLISSNVFCQDKETFFSMVAALKEMPASGRPDHINKIIAEFPKSPVYLNDTTFSIYYYGKANEVEIAGDLQHGWGKPEKMEKIPCGEMNFFFKTYHVPADARLDYQLIVDKQYITDPRNSNITPSGFGPHSEIAMPQFKRDPLMQERKDVPKGTFDTLTFVPADKSLLPRKVKIYVPAGNNEKLCLLLVYDGIEAIDFMSYPAVLDNLIADKKIRPTVVVFIAPGDRFAESVGKNTDDFISCLCKELIPLVQSKYKISPKAADHGISGISAGGHLALVTVMEKPEVFGCAAGQSSAITPYLRKKLEAYGKNKNRPELKIYFDAGRYDLEGMGASNKTFGEINSELHETLVKDNVPHIFHPVNDGHSWANWRQRTGEILQFFFPY